MNGLDQQIKALQKRNDQLIGMLTKTEAQLYRWAEESRAGGWSTHQVTPMTEWAQRIRMIVLGISE